MELRRWLSDTIYTLICIYFLSDLEITTPNRISTVCSGISIISSFSESPTDIFYLYNQLDYSSNQLLVMTSPGDYEPISLCANYLIKSNTHHAFHKNLFVFMSWTKMEIFLISCVAMRQCLFQSAFQCLNGKKKKHTLKEVIWFPLDLSLGNWI